MQAPIHRDTNTFQFEREWRAITMTEIFRLISECKSDPNNLHLLSSHPH